MTFSPIRLLIVDDSALARAMIGRCLAPHSGIQIIGSASDPYIARDKILQLKPDVIILDIEMPRMDGITFLKLIMKHRPMPVIIMSSLAATGSQKALEALNAGAFEVFEKAGSSCSSPVDGTRLAKTIEAAAHGRRALGIPVSFERARPELRRLPSSRPLLERQLILLGASTGGTEALRTILCSLPADLPGICIVQHIPGYFSKAFADRLNEVCAMDVREAQEGMELTPGLALVAPGGYHMLLRGRGGRYRVQLNLGPPLHHQRPAVDVLFDSAVRAGAGPRTVAAVLTGMGVDGAAGLARLSQAGAATIAQDEESSVVFGMPREAIRLGAAQHVLPLSEIAKLLEQLCLTKQGMPAPTRFASHTP
jgi:two-component system, chemotaxis family, protein-glutamate methylesterase/glutaminase